MQMLFQESSQCSSPKKAEQAWAVTRRVFVLFPHSDNTTKKWRTSLLNIISLTACYRWVIMRIIRRFCSFSKVKMERATARQTWSICANYSDSLVKKFITPPVISGQRGHERPRSGVSNWINYQQTGFGWAPCSHWGQGRQNKVLFDSILQVFQVKREDKKMFKADITWKILLFIVSRALMLLLQNPCKIPPWFSSRTSGISVWKKIQLNLK